MAIPDPIVPSATKWIRLLDIGSTGPDVEAIQTKLKLKKGKYGTETQTAVMNYQKKYTDLNDSGVVDEDTFNHIINNTKLGTDIPESYSGKKHNYKKGDWVAVKPNSGNQASQLYENDGYFKILDVPDDYTIIINVDWPKDVKGYAIAGGTTAKVIFGPTAEGGVKTIPTVSDNSTKGSRNKVDNSGTRSKGSTSTGNVETKTRKVARNTEFCNNLIQIKQYLNTNKGGDLTVNCKKTQKTLNQIMLALTGGAQIKPVTPVTPVTPVDQPQYNVVQPESPTNQFL
jgi:peptidoglycan hydrolase-like protein with peptidoglycan-binding domain